MFIAKNKKDTSLVIFYKQLGDLLLMEPALSKLVSITKSDVYIATNSEFAPLFSLMHNIHLAPSCMLYDISHVFSFDHRFRSCMRALLTISSIKHLILTNQKYLKIWHQFFFKTIEIEETSSKYRAKYFFDAISQISSMPFRPPQLIAPPPWWKPNNLPPTYIVIHATSAWKSKSWSPKAWATTIIALKKVGVSSFVITGGNAPWEIKFSESIVKQSKCDIVNLCGKTNIQEYISIIFDSSMVLSVDGSAAHLAAAFKRPNLTLFGPTHPLHWHWPTKISKFIDARNFSLEPKPSVNSIPSEVCIKEAIKLWKLVR